MNRSIKNKNIVFKVGIILITLGILFSTVKKIFHIPLFIPGLLIIIFYTIIYRPQIFFKKSIISTLLLFIVLVIYNSSNHFNNFPKVHLSPFGLFTLIYPLISSALIIENLLVFKNTNNTFVLKVGKLSFIFIIIMAVSTIIAEIFEPGITRRGSSEEAVFWINAFTFGGMYGVPFLFAIVINCVKNHIPLILYLSILLSCLLLAGFLTALLFTFFLAIIAYLQRINMKNPILVIVVLAVILLFVNNHLNTFIELLPKLPNEVYSQKTDDMSKIAEGTISLQNVSIRENVYEKSIQSFFKHPFLGSGEWKSTGEHSYWLDRLAFMGIFGTIFYLVVLIAIYKSANKLIITKKSKVNYKYYFGSFLFLLFLNPFYQIDFWFIIFLFCPLIMNYFDSIYFQPKNTVK